jgi:hypothetical protein
MTATQSGVARRIEYPWRRTGLLFAVVFVISEPSEGDSADNARACVIDESLTKDARDVIIPRDTQTLPKVWSIHDLVLSETAEIKVVCFTAPVARAFTAGGWRAETDTCL